MNELNEKQLNLFGSAMSAMDTFIEKRLKLVVSVSSAMNELSEKHPKLLGAKRNLQWKRELGIV